ncbi:MAG TPA: response regulator, partial [Casimicrobiaceae bacterium]|nr:response regulator [Casimicrobiaceae bacterium]
RGMVIVSHDNGRDAVTALHAQPNVEAILMDIMMPEMDGIDTIREIRRIPACKNVPIIAVTAKAMKGDREKCMEAGAWDYLAKPVDTDLMVGTLRALYDADDVLRGRNVMVVDDDMRNIFALTSLLEDRGMNVVSHDNGRDAVTALHAQPNVEAILMDIMMPEMDGIDTIREIRQIPACRDTPIIAVTAKAMKGDREKCMEAGAWDYLSKPVDTELMLGCLRGWLSR